MTVLVYPPASPFAPHDARLVVGERIYPAAIGRTGLIAEAEKREGDGATPVGQYRLLAGFYRADRIGEPQTAGLKMTAIQPGMGWQDDPASPDYNSLIMDDYPSDGDERFLREDGRYDILIVLDHNAAWPHPEARPPDCPAKPGAGSAIFLHVWNTDNGQPTGTAGCVAVSRKGLLEVLKTCTAKTLIDIRNSE
ncbi:L,D-transpeptidase family protein [Maricaulis sp.]|uniref:L,D-transpeptidase family protein n=1 Tax=Maricaulis sp. TaxID=1486257 RepID=UPI002608F932|nr:L,D-transpeptidase family protein [Maricaulis sp.]